MTSPAVRSKDKAMRVPMPGGEWNIRGFQVNQAATLAQLKTSAQRLHRLILSSQWALGDLGLAIQEIRRVEVQTEIDGIMRQAEAIDVTDSDSGEHRARLIEKAERLRREPIRVTQELAAALDIGAGYWQKCVQLSLDFPPESRNPALGPEHHRWAIWAARNEQGEGNPSAAPEQKVRERTTRLLETAQKEKWTESETRSAARSVVATVKPPALPAMQDPFPALTACNEWAIGYKQKVDGLTKDQRIRLVRRMHAILALLEALQP